MHWADHAAKLLASRGNQQTIASGITPSGSFHIGHLREILSAEMIHRSCLDLGLESRYIFIVDSMDPLRRVYSFLDQSYERYIGHPLAFVPAPNQNGMPDPKLGNYCDFFLGPFLKALEEIGVKPQLIMNHEVYSSGVLEDLIHEAMSRREDIKGIIESISGRELGSEWFPYNPLNSDGSFDNVTIIDYNRPFVRWIDGNGIEGVSDIRKADGKMPWRVDWAARWGLHGITCEPAGKDHGASGGSYDTAIPISKILGYEPPPKMVYEWIQIKGGGPMSSSTGNTIGPIEALNIVPPEILRYLIARSKMSKHIDFNTGKMLFDIADEYERIASSPPTIEPDMPRRKRVAAETSLGALRMSQKNRNGGVSGSQVPLRHLALLAQIRKDDDQIWGSLRNSGHIPGHPTEDLVLKLKRLRNWIESDHFPTDFRIEVTDVVTEKIRHSLSSSQLSFLKALGDRLNGADWNDDAINSAIAVAIQNCETRVSDCYEAIYTLLVGKSKGPKVSTMMAELDQKSVLLLFDSL